MISFMYILVAAAYLTQSVTAQKPTTPYEAAAFWTGVDSVNTAPVPPATKGRVLQIPPRMDGAILFEAKLDGDDERKRGNEARQDRRRENPYVGRVCPRDLDVKLPAKASCSRNNCFRSFIDARGPKHEARHCPANTFAFCCKWLSAGALGKQWAVETGYVFEQAPYTKPCESKRDNDSVGNVVAKIDDVCGCTVGQKVDIDVEKEFYLLRLKGANDAMCRPEEDCF